MKKLFYLFLTLCLFIPVKGQEWNKNENSFNFFEKQKEFYDYWNPLNVKNGTYQLDGQTHHAGGWKQYKRWEWFWSTRVNPITGEFPLTTSFNEYYKQQKLKSLSSDTLGEWKTLGPISSKGGYAGIGRINCVNFGVYDPNIIYAGAASGGLWKSIDNGYSWVCLTDNLPVLGISDIIVQKGESNDIIYIATGDMDSKDNYSIGVLKSTNGGNSWSITGLNWTQSQLRTINRIIDDPINKNILFAATSIGVFKTIDGGINWSNMSSIVLSDIEYNPANNQIMYGSTRSGGDVYLSINGGTTWTNVLNTTGSRTELSISKSSPNIVYALVAATNNGLFGIYKSVDNGNTYTQITGSAINMLGWACSGTDTGGQAWYDLCIISDPNNSNVVFIGGINTWKSSDGGITWKINNHWSSSCSGQAKIVHADKHSYRYHPISNELFECNDGGIYRSPDNGVTWIDITNGMIISQIYRIGVSQTESNTNIAGLQDNGTKALILGTWKDVIGGDGMECIVDYSNPNIQYGELYYGSIYKTENKWTSSTPITGTLNESSAWVTPYVIDPKIPNTLYVGKVNVWKTTDKGVTWTKISNFTSSSLRSLCVNDSNTNFIYAATGSILYKTTDGGSTWTTITGTLPVTSSSITYIATKNNDPNVIWVTMGQFNSYCVFQSIDGGLTWVNISSGLPAVPTNCIVQNIQNQEHIELYVGTDIGVYMKFDNNDWVRYNDGLPNVVVNELEIFYSNNPEVSRLRAATYGRGLWESPLNSTSIIIVNTPPVFTSDPIVEINGKAGETYNSTLADNVYDPDATDILTFTKISGPAWLSVSNNGIISGIPTINDVGLNTFSINVTDNKGGIDTATLQITILNNVISYCEPTGINNINDYIVSIELNSTISSTGRSIGGYQYYITPIFKLSSGKSYIMKLSPYKANIKNFWRVWIDYNKDGFFSDATELVLNLPNKRGLTKGNFVVPTNASVGTTRMRIAMKNGSFMSSCENGYYGEVEDYDVEITTIPAIVNNENPMEFKLYPNPADQIITIIIPMLDKNTTMTIYSNSGKMIDRFLVYDEITTIDIKDYIAGIYYVIIQTSDGVSYKKFIKK